MLVGDSVLAKGIPATVRFIGTTDFAPGVWVGVELASADGKHDGSVQGVRYFTCPNKHGMFVREAMVTASRTPSRSLELTRPSLISSDASLPQDMPLIHRVVDKLQAKLKRTTDELKECRLKVADLQTKVSTAVWMEKEHEALKQEKEELEAHYNELKESNTSLKDELELIRQLEEEIKSGLALDLWTADDATIILTRNKQLELLVDDLEALITDDGQELLLALVSRHPARLTSQLDEARNKISELQQKLEALADVEVVMESLNVENEDLLAKVTTLNQHIDELNELSKIENEEQAKLEMKLRDEIKQLQVEIEQSQQSMEELKRKNKFLESRVIKLRSEARANSTQDDDDSPFNQLTMIHDQAFEELNLELRKAQVKYQIERFRYQLTSIKLESAEHQGTSSGFQAYKVKEFKKTIEVILDASFSEISVTIPHIIHSFRVLIAYLTQIEKLLYFGNIDTLEQSLNLLKVQFDKITGAVLDMTPLLIEDLFVSQFLHLLALAVMNSGELAGRHMFQFFFNLISLEVKEYRDIIGTLRNHMLACTDNTNSSLADLKSQLTLATLALAELESGVTAKQFELDALDDHQTTRLDFKWESILEKWHQSSLIVLALSSYNIANDIIPSQSKDIIDELLDDPQKLEQIHKLSDVLKAYELVVLSPVDIVDIEEAPKSIHDQVSHQSEVKRASIVTSSSADLQQQVIDDKLHIDMLEKNMKQLNLQWQSQREALKNQLKAVQDQVETLKKQKQEMATHTKALEAEVATLVKANSLYDLKEFDSLLEENNHIDKLRMIGEMNMLRKMIDATYQWRPQAPALAPLQRMPKVRKGDCTITDALSLLTKTTVRPLVYSETEETPLHQRFTYQHKVMVEGYEWYKGLNRRAL